MTQTFNPNAIAAGKPRGNQAKRNTTKAKPVEGEGNAKPTTADDERDPEPRSGKHDATCPWSDPETFLNPATVGLPCTCADTLADDEKKSDEEATPPPGDDPAAAAVAPPEPPAPALIEFPIGELVAGYATNRFDFKSTSRQAAAAKMLANTLSNLGERFAGGRSTHRDGTTVETANDAIKWFLDQLADAIEAETGKDLTTDFGLIFR